MAVTTGAFQAGEVGVVQVALPATVAAAQIDRASRTATVLGLPAATRRSATRVVDRFGGRTYDEIAEYDARDRLLSLQRFDTDGRLLARRPVRLARAPAATALSGTGARRRAEQLVTSLGLEARGHAADRGRAVERGLDGRLGPASPAGSRSRATGCGSSSGPTARSTGSPAPSGRSPRDRPSSSTRPGPEPIVRGALDVWFTGDARARRDAGRRRARVGARRTTRSPPVAPDAPVPVLRLAWVARVSASGTLSENLRALEVYVDAGDGSILGGDILR